MTHLRNTLLSLLSLRTLTLQFSNKQHEVSNTSERVVKLPWEQEAIRAKCFHPTGTFVEFEKEEIEQSIPDRLEKIVGTYPDQIAVKTRNHLFNHAELNNATNRVASAILFYLAAMVPTL